LIESAPYHSILIVDFGSQVTQLIARRVREAGVYSEIAPLRDTREKEGDVPLERADRPQAEAAFLSAMQPKGIILSGSPASVPDSEGSPARAASAVRQRPADPRHLLWPAGDEPPAGRRGPKPGHETGEGGEFGRAFLTVTEPCALFDGLWQVGERHQVWMSHGDKVTQFAPGFASSPPATARPLR
jgi:GMP synthase (glutamine-hydrolysing)